MTSLPSTIIELLSVDRPWIILCVSDDPRELSSEISLQVQARIKIDIRRLSPALSEYDLERVIDSDSAKRCIFVIGDIASHSAAFLASVVRRCTSNNDLLVIGSNDYSQAKLFANKISIVVDERIGTPESASTELLIRTLNLIQASSVECTAELATTNRVSNEDSMRYIVLPQILLREIRPSIHRTGGEAKQHEAEQRPSESTTVESIFEELHLPFIKSSVPQTLAGTSASKGRGSLSRKGSSSHEIDRSRVRSRRAGQFALFHTILAAAPFQNSRRVARANEMAVILKSEDIRRYPFLQRSRKLTVVVIDSSGSMAASSRIRYAKGLVSDLLKHSYRDRSYVALVVARGNHATTVAAPTRSIGQVLGALRMLPTGGATPLVSSLEESLRVVHAMTHRYGDVETEVILITDGKGNIGESSSIGLQTLAAEFHRRHIRLSVVDLIRANPSAVRFAETLGARYTFYPRGETASHFA